jgi:hypothetical protein
MVANLVVEALLRKQFVRVLAVRLHVIQEVRKNCEKLAKSFQQLFGPWRKNKIYNPYEDIRKNLFEHYENPSTFNSPS